MTACSLCHNTLSHLRVGQENLFFCCHGCLTVYNILQSASALDHFEKHPIFQQAVKFGLISNPTLLDQIQKQEKELEKKKWQLEIQNMWCTSCAELIRYVLLKNAAISSCVVDYATDLSVIEYYPQLIKKEDIASIIHELGYVPKEISESLNSTVPKSLYMRFVIAAFCSLNVMMFAYPLYAIYFHVEKEGIEELFSYLCLGFSLPVICYSAYPIFFRCYQRLKLGFIGMEALVSLGIVSAFILSLLEIFRGSSEVYFDSMTVIVTFVLLGKILESKAKFSSKEVLFRLNRSLPQKARKLENGKEQHVLIKEVKIGDFLIAHTGEKIVLDGAVYQGQGACDESLISGESLPLLKNPGSPVIAGAIVQSGSLVYQVDKSEKHSSIQKIIHLIEKDFGKKALSIPYSDKIAQVFTPLVLLIASAVWYANSWNKEGAIAAIAILLISCPCAIGIAAPLAESYMILKLAKMGIIVRNRNILRLLGKKVIYVFDKTGTITEGKFQIVSGLEKLTEEQLILVKTVTAFSAHPLCYAIHHSVNRAQKEVDYVEEVPGKGIKAIINGKKVFLGSYRFMQEEGINITASTNDLTTVYFGEENMQAIAILLEDKIKKEALEVKNLLKGEKCIILSGDNKKVVEKVAKKLHFDIWHGDMTPLDKKSYIECLKKQGNIVFMIGDGINDAPSIATADIGASIMNASDISIHVSDLLFTEESFNLLPFLQKFGQKGQKILKQNFFWAFFYNIIGIGLAMFGMLSPVFSAFAMTASSLLVLFNSKRINS